MRKEESVSKETIEFWFYEEKNIMIKVKDVTIKKLLCHSQEVVRFKIERDNKGMKKYIVGKGCEKCKITD